jgi:hypothetical protein
MSRFTKNIGPYVTKEIEESQAQEVTGNYEQSFKHLENAHVMGQESTYWHVKVHWLMFLWGIRRRDSGEVVGQVVRILGAFFLTAVKAVPKGNTGGTNVSPTKVMPMMEEHAEIINKVKAGISS